MSGRRSIRGRVAAAAALASMLSAGSSVAAETASAPPAGASGCDRIGRRNAIETQPLAFAARGVALSYERLLAPPRFSVAALAGARAPALGDYASLTVSGGLAARAWIRPHAGRDCDAAMSGPFLGVRMDAGYTRVTENGTSRFVGSSVGLAQMLEVGWRFVAWRVVEATPFLGVGVREDVDPRGGLVTAARGAVAVGFSVGWMF